MKNSDFAKFSQSGISKTLMPFEMLILSSLSKVYNKKRNDNYCDII